MGEIDVFIAINNNETQLEFSFLEKATMNINICAKCDSGELTEEGVNEL